MMSFLQNILQRHQLGAASQPTSNPGLPESYIVQPRLQSRFESDLGAFAQTHEGRHDERLRAVTAEPESDLPPTRPLPRSPTATQPAGIGGELGSGQERNEGINGRMDAVAPSFVQSPFEHKPVQQQADGDHAPTAAIAASAVARPGLPQTLQPTEPRRAVSQAQAEVSGELNQRIETVLQAFDRLQTHTASHQTPRAPRQPVLQGSDNQSVHAREQPSPIAPADNRVLPRSADTPHLGLLGPAPMSTPTSATAEPVHQREPTGLLQIPDWLADIRAELHNRWRELNQQVESEPVVNVTIGRVEIRAVQNQPAKQAQARNKPSGVMTLDAYLMQRDRRGPA